MYKRDTELRHLLPNDVYKLGVILDDNNCWKKLMEVIPRQVNADASTHLDWEQAVASGFKYNNDHIRLIENAIKRSGESRLFSQILFDEWGTSGRKHERPTVGVLLQLLVKAELFRAAEHVATALLNEPAPPRPANGPAARIDISLSEELFNDVEPYVNDDTCYPDTEALNEYAKGGAASMVDNNKDYYTKYQCINKEMENLQHRDPTPKPPPRPLRASRQQRLQSSQLGHESHEMSTLEAGDRTNTMHGGGATTTTNPDEIMTHSSSLNIPNISALMTNSLKDSQPSQLSGSDVASQHTESTNLSDDAIIPNISLLAMEVSAPAPTEPSEYPAVATEHEILPLISELNVKGDFTRTPNSATAPPSTATADNMAMSSDTNASPFHQSRSSSSLSIDYGDDDDVDLDGEEDDDDDDDDDDMGVMDGGRNIAGEDIAVDCDDDGQSLPNLTLLRQPNPNNDNDSSLTTVTGTSGENSFELSMNDCSSTSNENIPCLSELKP